MGSLIAMSLLAIFTSLMATTNAKTVGIDDMSGNLGDDDELFTSSTANFRFEGRSLLLQKKKLDLANATCAANPRGEERSFFSRE